MTTTTVDTQAIVAGSGGTSTPVKLTLQDSTSIVCAQVKITTTRAASPGVNGNPKKQITLNWAFSPENLTLATVPDSLRHCTKNQSIVLNPDLSIQRFQIRDKVAGQYCYFWFEYPQSTNAYSIEVVATELSFSSSSSGSLVPSSDDLYTVGSTSFRYSQGFFSQSIRVGNGTTGLLLNTSGLTSGTGQTLTLATLDNNQNVIVAPHGTGMLVAPTTGINFGVGGTYSINPSGAQGLTLGSAGGEGFAYNNITGGVLPAQDLRPFGTSVKRWSQGFFGPSGLRIGNGTAGPTITASDDTSAANLVFTPSTTGAFSFAGNVYAAANGSASSVRFGRNSTTGIYFSGGLNDEMNIACASTLMANFNGGSLITFYKRLLTTASSSGAASLTIPHGSAPTSPANGDMWTTTAGLFVQINGVTVGPLS